MNRLGVCILVNSKFVVSESERKREEGSQGGGEVERERKRAYIHRID
jgi:hypothetical protein